MADNKKSIFQRIADLTYDAIDGYTDELKKSRNQVTKAPYGVTSPAIMRHTWNRDLEKEWAEYGYKPKLTLLTDNHKLMMYLKDPIVGAIIQTRITQVTEFATPQKDKARAGFKWVKKDETEPTAAEEPTIKMLTDFILNCGIVDDEREDAGELMNFETFMKLTFKDSLIYDNLCIEFVPDKDDRVHHFMPVSGATMRLLEPNFQQTSLNENGMYDQLIKPMDPELLAKGKYKYGQVVNGQLRKVYTQDEIIMEFRNPINDFFTNGYPISELDLLMNAVSAHINADKYNQSIFTHGITSDGIINLKGEVDDEQLKALRRSWYAQGIGPDSMLKTPITNAPEGLEFIKLNTSHKDLEYSNYITYLIKVICAIFQISPEEIGFDTGGKSDGASGNSQNYNNVEKKLEFSKDKGLTPLLRFMENIINEKILPKFSKELYKKYRFKFVGINEEDKLQEVDRLEAETKVFKTINEARKEKGMSTIEGGDIIRDSVYMQWYSQFSKEAEELNESMAAQEGGMGDGMGGGDASGVEYVDEDGNPVDPSEIDPNMEFQDEDGNPVDKDGNPLDGSDEGDPDAKLPFESDEDDEDGDEKLPFEGDDEDEEESPKASAKNKLPFED